MKQMQQGHIYAFDVMRLVAAFFVVMIHCAASRSVSGLVYNTVARFSVPVFVLISGYILLPSDRETGYFLQKCARTFGTLLLTAGLYACYQLLTGRMADTGVKALVKTLLCEPSHLWYLYAAMALYLLTPLSASSTGMPGGRNMSTPWPSASSLDRWSIRWSIPAGFPWSIS